MNNRLIILLVGVAWMMQGQFVRAQGAEVAIPAAPKDYFTDEAKVVDEAAAKEFDRKLAQFERDTSNQVVVVIFRKAPAGVEVEDYCLRLANAWKLGQKGRNNGVLLVVFVDDHKLRIETGRGLEAALSDHLCKSIIDEKIVPRFKQKDFAGGIAAGIDAIIAATRDAYKGDGKTHKEMGE